ncbi:MAG: UDP-3-O-(3-hydroxymyristoyl)glucosamine N-acyltransferase [Thiomicrospira sp.]|jgi:UDP-3-O-[3-hydroxymyristoyl] glucosamine N-acyltransferase|nr:UDP-3-O-(3-hydroxymyristoyl)glucosamine N-acyltransferase [Thiomicrospira sp.]
MSSVQTLAQLVAHLAQNGLPCELKGSAELEVSGVAPLDKAVAGQLSFLSDDAYKKDLPTTQASVVLLKPEMADLCPTNAIIVSNPYAAYAYCAQQLYTEHWSSSVHHSALIAPDVALPSQCVIGPNVVIESGVSLAQGVIIGAGCVLESGVCIGANTRLYPNVTVMHDCVIGANCFIKSGAVIGGDGFGWAKHNEKWIKIPQLGRVVIGDYVSIGNNSTIDRGALEDTVVEDYCIIDNLVHLGHNVHFGSGGAMAAFTGISGSTRIGKNCVFAGQTATAGHVEIADNVTLMGRAAVTHSIHQSGVYAGLPAIPIADWQKNTIYVKNLAKMSERLKTLQKRVADLESKLGK